MGDRLIPSLACRLALALALLAGPAPALAIMGDSKGAALTGDADFDAGRAAFERQDWPGVIAAMTKVVERQPWHDEAYNLLGFAHRKLGDYDRALEFYDKALDLNPHNRGALEYLGEAYLEMGQPARAEAILGRLSEECRRVLPAGDGQDWPRQCEEWQELKAAYDAHRAGRPLPAHD
jgi:tetratricopeptide (TPR) repeat protein